MQRMQDDIDTSVWAPDVQQYTRMFYARYGMGPAGHTPWRLGRGLRPQAPKAGALKGSSDDTSTFLTKAHLDLQKMVPNTSLPLWQQFSSSPIEEVSLECIKKWATAMRPRSIHDLKPMLMLCQALLRDLAGVHEAEATQEAAQLTEAWKGRLEAQAMEHDVRAQVWDFSAFT
jgi:hypothetical protein